VTVGRSRGRGRARLRLWVAVVVTAAAAMVLASSAAAATATVTGCAENPLGFSVTFSGSGFAPNAVISGYDNGVFRGITTADARGNFVDFTLLVLSLPSEVSFVDTASNSAVVTVMGCGGGGGGGGQPETKDECKKGGYAEFTDPAFKNQGQCVSSVASKNK